VTNQLVVNVEGAENSQALLRKAVEAGVTVARVVPRTETLEDLFVREAIEH
jgi:hypothetical protein